MNLTLNEKAYNLTADELAAYVRLAFRTNTKGYVSGTRKELAEKAMMSVPRLKKAIEGLFEKQFVTLNNGKLYILEHNEIISHSEGEQPIEIPKAEKPVALTVSNVADNTDEIKRVCEYYNRVIAGKGMAQIKSLTSKRKQYVNARIHQYGLDAVYQVINNAAASLFLNGKIKDFIADFEWIMRPNNFIKVLEGKYGNRQANTESQENEYYSTSTDLLRRLNSQREATDNK